MELLERKYNIDYSDMIVKTKDEFVIDARILHDKLDVGRDFTTWIKARITKYGFEEDVDYIVKNIPNGSRWGGNNKTEYMLTLDMAKQLCRLERNKPKSSSVLKQLIEVSEDKEIIIKEAPRLEYQFADMLEKITGLEWDKQYPIDGGKYRLDFKLNNDLIVEYDEEQHKYQQQEDKERMKYCQKWLANNETNDCIIPAIRVKKGEELEGLHKIINFLSNKDLLN